LNNKLLIILIEVIGLATFIGCNLSNHISQSQVEVTTPPTGVQNKTIESTGIVLSEPPTEASPTLEPEIATNTPIATPSEI